MEPYFKIFRWMTEELGLKGSELMVYALIYSFTESAAGGYSGSQTDIGDWCGLKERQVRNILLELREKNLIASDGRDGSKLFYIAVRPALTPAKIAGEGGKNCRGKPAKIAGEGGKNCRGKPAKIAGEGGKNCRGIHIYKRNSLINSFNSSLTADAEKEEEKIDTEFDLLWESYPNRVGEEEARKAYAEERERDGELAGKILDAIRQYRNWLDTHLNSRPVRGGEWFKRKYWNDWREQDGTSSQKSDEPKPTYDIEEIERLMILNSEGWGG